MSLTPTKRNTFPFLVSCHEYFDGRVTILNENSSVLDPSTECHFRVENLTYVDDGDVWAIEMREDVGVTQDPGVHPVVDYRDFTVIVAGGMERTTEKPKANGRMGTLT